jgi:hypothetical protein
MNSNLHAGSMQQSRHNIFEQNHLLLKISTKSVTHWACLSSQASTTKEMRESKSVYKLHSMVNKSYLQHFSPVCLLKKSISRIACLVALSQIFTKQINLP